MKGYSLECPNCHYTGIRWSERRECKQCGGLMKIIGEVIPNDD